MTIVTQYSWETDTFTHHAPVTERQAFRAAMALVADTARAKLPECNGRVDKALALVLSGDVTLQADGSAVVSSQCDPPTLYRVEHGVCTCKDFAHAPHGLCKHRLGAALQRRAMELTRHQPALQEPAPEPAPAQPAPESVPAQPGLPEAPASANCHVTIAGSQVQVTLRDTDETRLLRRLTALLAQYPVEPAAASPGVSAEGWCAIHNVQMRRNEKDGRSWYSHQAPEGAWCKGKPKGQGH